MNAKRIAALSFAALLSFSAASCSDPGGASEDYGTLSVADITLTVGESAEIQPVFSEAGEWTVEYTFSGDAIDISEGRVYALAANQTVTVTAYTPRHETQFTVTTLQKPLFAIADFTAWVDGPAVDFAPAWIDPAYDAREDFELVDELCRLSGVPVPRAIEEIRTAPVRHKTVCEVSEMPKVVKEFLGL